MQIRPFAGAIALAFVAVSAPALADDPRDPVLSRNAEARARDKAIIRRLNQEQLAYVRERDARYAEGWRAYREAPARQADYERRMAEWRRAVRLCEAGRHEYCAR